MINDIEFFIHKKNGFTNKQFDDDLKQTTFLKQLETEIMNLANGKKHKVKVNGA